MGNTPKRTGQKMPMKPAGKPNAQNGMPHTPSSKGASGPEVSPDRIRHVRVVNG